MKLLQFFAGAIIVLMMASSSPAQNIPGSWHRTVVPQALQPGNSEILDFGFRDSLNGILFMEGGYVVSTTDGGHTWSLDTNLNNSLPSKHCFCAVTCSGPHQGFYHSGSEGCWKLSPNASARLGPPNFNEVNWGAYKTLAEKMYDTSYGFRLVQQVSTSDQGQYQDTVRLIVTHDGWSSSVPYGEPYIISPFLSPFRTQFFYGGLIVDSNDVWTAKQSTMVHTTNGGITWDSITIVDTSIYSPVWADFFADQKSREIYCMATKYKNAFTKTDTGQIDFAYSSDYGATWRVDSTFSASLLWRMACPAPGIIWATISQGSIGNVQIFPPFDAIGNPKGFSRKMAYSSDHGITWAIDSVTFVSDSLMEMYFVDARHGWVASWKNDSAFVWYYDPGTASVQNSEKELQASNVSTAILLVYPDPALNFITYQSPLPVTITDLLGRSFYCSQSISKVDISSLTSGVYFITDGYAHGKFFKR